MQIGFLKLQRSKHKTRSTSQRESLFVIIDATSNERGMCVCSLYVEKSNPVNMVQPPRFDGRKHAFIIHKIKQIRRYIYVAQKPNFDPVIFSFTKPEEEKEYIQHPENYSSHNIVV